MSLEINSIAAHDFSKLDALKVFNTIHNFNLICLSETFLDSSFSQNDPDLNIAGDEMIRADHPLNIKQGRVSIYFKDTLPLNVTNIN